MKATIVLMVIGLMIAIVPCAPSANEPPQGPSDNPKRDVDSELPMGPILMSSSGLVIAVVGAGFAWQAYQENEDFNRRVNGEYPLASKRLADDINAHSITANILMFGGAAVMLGGILWWVLDDDYDRGKTKEEGKTALRWRPMMGPAHASVVVAF